MDEGIKFFVGLDTHKDSIAVAVCEAGREPSRFVGIMGPNVPGVLKMLRKYGPAQQVSVVKAPVLSTADSGCFGVMRGLKENGRVQPFVQPP